VGNSPGQYICQLEGELKAITTRSGLVTEGPTVPNPPKSVNPEEEECVEEILEQSQNLSLQFKEILFCILGTLFHRISPNSLLEEFADELAFISYPPNYDDNRACDIESNIREIEFLLYQGEDSNFKDLIDQSVLTHCDDLFVDHIPEMFTDEQPLDYSFLPRFDDFSKDDVLPSPDNEDKVFNPGSLIHEKSVKIITRFAQEKKLAVSFASWLFEDFDPPFYELLVFKEVPNSMRLLPFSSENEEKVFKPGIYTSKKFHCCFLSELSHPGFRMMIHLLDPPLHEFLPDSDLEQIVGELTKDTGMNKDEIYSRIEKLLEVNPKLGFRGCSCSSHANIKCADILSTVVFDILAIESIIDLRAMILDIWLMIHMTPLCLNGATRTIANAQPVWAWVCSMLSRCGVQGYQRTYSNAVALRADTRAQDAFTISAEVPKFFMQQFWYTIKKIQGTDSYKFVLANKRCIVDAEVFRKILDICSRVKGEEFTESRGKGSQGKKTADVSQESVDVSDESEPEPTKKKTGSRSTKGVVIQDTSSSPKPKPAASKLKQKGTRGSSEGTGKISRVLDESTVVSATSSERTGTKPGVPDEEKVTLEENVILEWGSENKSKHSEESQLNFNKEEKKDNDGDADDENEDDDHICEGTNDEDAKTESDEDEIYKYKIQEHTDVDVKMVEAETVERENKEKDEMTDAAKANIVKTIEEKGDAELAGNAMISDYQVKESTELPLLSSSLSVSSSYGTNFLNLSFDVSLTGVLKDFAEAKISSLMDVYIQ
nr:pyruvate, phosphate dikinase [Tanacetum cinerariifolium]